jgi:hypothetical protein
MFSKKNLLYGGIILLVCLACALPAGALELNPFSYIMKQPVPVQTVNKTVVNHALGSPIEKVTVLPRVTTGTSPVDIPTMSQVHSGTGTCTQDTPVTTLDGTITEIMYANNWGTTYTVMKLSGGSDVLLFAADGGNRDRVNHLFETAYIRGNRIHVTTTSGCSIESFSGYDGTNKQYPAYKALFIDLGPVHP